MKRISIERIRELQQRTQNIRNICILAHVDHGKTTLADSLVASNGIISQKLAGKLRYLDSRKDEQERGITMKSSAITLYYPKRDLLVNLIDSPGHVDFTSEVMAAVRLCDGAVIVVDVVEGVCAQTKVALNLAWSENLKPMLVLNKIDRLILEKKMTPLDAYIHLQQILEQVNAVVGELFATDVLEKTSNEISTDSSTEKSDDALVFDWTSGLDDADDSTLYFSPEQGNVVFASAFDGWGFSTSQFAQLYAEKLGMKKQVLEKTLWGDYYLNAKAKRILKGAQAKCKKPLFAQLILENLWEVYDAVCCRRDKVAMEKIVKSLGVTLTARDTRHNDPRVQLQALCSQWLPLADAFLEMTMLIPSPAELPEARVEALMCPPSRSFDSLPEETRQLRKAFLDCSPCDEAPVIVCISKMVAVETKQLPENRTRLLSLEEITQRREQARQRHAERMALAAVDSSSTPDGQKNGDAAVPEEDASQEREEDDSTFIAFGRVFSGTLKRGQQVYVLGPKHDPAKFLEKAVTVDPARRLKDLGPEEHVTVATIEKLYLLMGRELEQLECVPAGNILGIGGLEEHVVRTATLSSCTACAPFADMRGPVTPILRVALEPRRLADMAALVRGLKLLHQADPCVQVLLQETGEHVLLTAGEVHLERCLNDLTERFAKVEINVSDPIVPFRETIVEPPKVDMVNEVIEDKNTIQKAPKDEEDDSVAEDGTVTIFTPNRQVTIKLRAEPLPEEVTELLEKHTSLIRDYDQALSSRSQKLPESLSKNIAELQKTLAKAFADAATLTGPLCQEPMMGVAFVVDQWDLDMSVEDPGTYGPLSGQIISAVKEGCRRAFQAQPQRLLCAMYSCTIQATSDALPVQAGLMTLMSAEYNLEMAATEL
ncbi:hypothetical protein HPB52_015477 [Rhipicephalus sanguineus]|uniref:Tr-type G domain-containing protein n=1 Tax=Rhipicephalus sanguineus TaxID=34632 RepID=A0A9D4SZF7_RHISA|nr:hypothetical protein HPB52_015477 [Rhipicephalus sanguineus]